MKRSSAHLNERDVELIKLLLDQGEYCQHQIAASFDINQGRISEIKTGKTWGHVRPAKSLPPGFRI
jgi:predicted XRE-type DNA-binding protein